MNNLRKIVSGVAFAGLIGLGCSQHTSNNLQSENKKERSLEEQCEMTKEGLFYKLQEMKKYGRKEFITPEVNISKHSKERWEIEYKCAKEYVENETGGAYGISKEEKDGKVKFIVFRKGNLT